MNDENRVSIWFFVGSLLTVYGIIILIVSIQTLVSPGQGPHVVLANLHAGVWWGILLLLLGIMYVVLFWPWKKKETE